jgi:Zn-dependent protease with chaperone function
MSQSVVELLNEQELQAVVAHEIGHAYVWHATREAQDAKDHLRLRQIELFCDAVSILTLRRLELNPRYLIASVEKMERFNNERFGRPLNSASYPTLSERKKSWTRVMNWIGSTAFP